MSEIEEIKSLLNQHVLDSNTFREKIKADLDIIKVHSEYTRKSVDTHSKKIEKIDESHNKMKGAMWIVSTLGLSAFIKTLVEIFKH